MLLKPERLILSCPKNYFIHWVVLGEFCSSGQFLRLLDFFSTLIGPIKSSRTGVAVVVIFYITVKNSEYLRRMKRVIQKGLAFLGL